MNILVTKLIKDPRTQFRFESSHGWWSLGKYLNFLKLEDAAMTKVAAWWQSNTSGEDYSLGGPEVLPWEAFLLNFPGQHLPLLWWKICFLQPRFFRGWALVGSVRPTFLQLSEHSGCLRIKAVRILGWCGGSTRPPCGPSFHSFLSFFLLLLSRHWHTEDGQLFLLFPAYVFASFLTIPQVGEYVFCPVVFAYVIINVYICH